MVRVFIFHSFNLGHIKWSTRVMSTLATTWVIVIYHLLLSRELLLSLVKVIHHLSPVYVTFGLQLRNIRGLWGSILMTTLGLDILRLYHFIFFFLRSPFTTFSISFLISLPPCIPRCHVGGIHALLSPVLFNDERIIGRSLKVVSFLTCFVKLYGYLI